ncbi:hypothetical protein KRX51_00085 [Corynebacterium sp. TAE3-ERU12]|uniref:hypothetical protein n=1 Tax=Corynebacterium sp. TAE3-ERU12 TaxID=2849491 RepID=UPI001C45F02E|nr:hypothetical protein [Corynebacterium sp. TAE3-ERU12]MBV7294324.1 hypothetical protein [Corynebacterium sp. TAE3-ERU12]
MATDEISDPLERLERNERSGRRAYAYTAGVIAATFLSAAIIAIIGAVTGGPICAAGKSHFICSHTFELLFPIVPSLVSLFGALGCFWLTWVQWSRRLRWRPWLAMCWVLMPFTLIWMTGTLPIAMLGVR